MQAIILKLVLGTVAPIFSSSALYALVACLVEAPICLLWLFYSGRRITPHGYIVPAMALGASSAATVALRFAAFITVPNPAYIYMIALLSAVWLYGANRLLGIPDKQSPWAGFGLVVSAALLIYFNS